MLYIAKVLLLTLVAIHAAIHVRPMLRHTHHLIHRKLGLKPGDKCSRKAAFIVILTMVLTGAVACAPVIHYGLDAIHVAISDPETA
jgi:hypothetical protein